ncbi:hypothetical protein PN36_17415 [Candidatus Thiomargarita nelsonii]|uniref:Glycosyltransferase subfamily 4-like N-terminal domain-containing protein n=1 Tax=Candidatus Thiomargarita nelsonii TaxID=1003181 RepID=A0A0A6P5B7_9GAMM|nr:hypothetical protein PN36_17415 [Candidatus Thiomargarita nelsonii]
MSKITINLARSGKQGTGLSNYSKHLLACMKERFTKLAVVSSDRSYQEDTSWEFIAAPAYVSTTKVSKIRPILWLLYAYFRFPKKSGYILSVTHHTVPKVTKQIITVHDLRVLLYPYNDLQKIYFRYLLPRALKKIDGIITVSQTTKKLLIKHYKIVPDKIYVIHNYIDVTTFKPDDSVTSPAIPYLLMVGAIWEHKNAFEVLAMHKYWAGRYPLKILATDGEYKQVRLVLA